MKNDNLKIIELVRNMRDELNRADSVMTWLYEKHPEVYSEIQNSELGDELSQDIRDDLERTDDITERIDIAMLIAATIGDASIPTLDKIYRKEMVVKEKNNVKNLIENIYKTESAVEIPYVGNLVDTEAVYNSLDDWCNNISKY